MCNELYIQLWNIFFKYNLLYLSGHTFVIQFRAQLLAKKQVHQQPVVDTNFQGTFKDKLNVETNRFNLKLYTVKTLSALGFWTFGGLCSATQTPRPGGESTPRSSPCWPATTGHTAPSRPPALLQNVFTMWRVSCSPNSGQNLLMNIAKVELYVNIWLFFYKCSNCNLTFYKLN